MPAMIQNAPLMQNKLVYLNSGGIVCYRRLFHMDAVHLLDGSSDLVSQASFTLQSTYKTCLSFRL